MKTFFDLREKSKDDPCWDNYTQVGMKKKGGKEVPNCVPADGIEKAKGYKKESYVVVSRGPGFEMRKNPQTGKVTKVYTESVDLEEKSVSQAQQKMMGMALAYKRGEMPDASPEVKKMAKSMTTKDLEDFAKTKHKGLPVKKESLDLDEEKKYVVKYTRSGDPKSGRTSAPLSKVAADKKAAQGNKVDKVGGKYTVIPYVESTEIQEMDLSKQTSKQLLMFYRKYADRKMSPSDANTVKAVRRELMKRGVSIKEEVELSEAKSGDELMKYAKSSGGIDKAALMKLAGKLQNHSATGNPSIMADIVKIVKDMDTDPRDAAMSIIKKNDPTMYKSIVLKAKLSIFNKEEVELDEFNSYKGMDKGRLEAAKNSIERSLANLRMKLKKSSAYGGNKAVKQEVDELQAKLRAIKSALGESTDLGEATVAWVVTPKKGAPNPEKWTNTELKNNGSKRDAIMKGAKKMGMKPSDVTVSIKYPDDRKFVKEDTKLSEGAVASSTVRKEIAKNGGTKISQNDKEITFMMGGKKHSVPLYKGFVADKHYMKLQDMFEGVEESGSWKQDSGWKKAQKIYKDRYGNVIKKQNMAKHLAKKAQQKTAEMDK